MTGPDVVTLGETMVSLRTGTALRLGGTLTLTMAGAESNVAIGLARSLAAPSPERSPLRRWVTGRGCRPAASLVSWIPRPVQHCADQTALTRLR